MRVTGLTRSNIVPRANAGYRPRYVFVINELGFIYSHFWTLARLIQRSGWDVIVVGRSVASPQQALEAGMTFIPLDVQIGIGGLVAEIRSMLKLRRILAETSPDVVHLVSLKNVLLGALLLRLSKKTRIIGAVTGLGSLFVEKRLLYRLIKPLVLIGMRIGFSKAKSILAVENQDDAIFFVDCHIVPPERVVVVPGAGVDPEWARPVQRDNDSVIVICVSRMIKNKGILDLIAAARNLKNDSLNFELWLVGDVDEGNPTSLSRSELREAEVQGVIKWLGKQHDVAGLLAQANIFCLPTQYREGLPRSLVEACAAGLAIVTTDVPGCREVVQDKVNGRLVEPGDVHALTEALRFFINEPSSRVNMGAKARSVFEERFTESASLAAFNECYRRLQIAVNV